MEIYRKNGAYIIEITFENKRVKVEVEFKEALLRRVNIQTDLTAQETSWFWQWLPLDVITLKRKGKHERVNITHIPEDLEFDAFWDKYDHKIGKKARVEKLWDALSDADKAFALQSIPRYNYWLANHPTIAKCYPETYLSQRRFENQYK